MNSSLLAYSNIEIASKISNNEYIYYNNLITC